MWVREEWELYGLSPRSPDLRLFGHVWSACLDFWLI